MPGVYAAVRPCPVGLAVSMYGLSRTSRQAKWLALHAVNHYTLPQLCQKYPTIPRYKILMIAGSPDKVYPSPNGVRLWEKTRVEALLA